MWYPPLPQVPDPRMAGQRPWSITCARMQLGKPGLRGKPSPAFPRGKWSSGSHAKPTEVPPATKLPNDLNELHWSGWKTKLQLLARAQLGGYSCIFHLQAVTAMVRDVPSPGTGRLRAETEGQTQVRGNHHSRHLSDTAEPQQMTGMSSFAIEGKAVPRTSPITQVPQPSSPRLHVDWMQDFTRTLNSEAVKSLCKNPIIPIFVTANLSLYLGPLTYPYVT